MDVLQMAEWAVSPENSMQVMPGEISPCLVAKGLPNCSQPMGRHYAVRVD